MCLDHISHINVTISAAYQAQVMNMFKYKISNGRCTQNEDRETCGDMKPPCTLILNEMQAATPVLLPITCTFIYYDTVSDNFDKFNNVMRSNASI